MAQSALERDPALRTPALYGHPVNTDTFYGPSVSVFTGFDCLDFQDLAGGGGGVSAHNSRALSLSFKFVPTGLNL